ncbi:DNA/RNA helicase domain-containing protein [Streptomyces sp. NPDC002817]|uniref:DNA/RNA helicase domain-containing protein n=1 Tax=Streptomyces sp. NPDC088357 TaxID=3154655 RepID=UPI00343726BF
MLFRESAASVAARLLEGSLALHLTENFRHQHGRMPARAEIRSWERSLPALVNALMEADLGDVEVLIEYNLPLTSKRADAVLVGVHPRTGEPSYVVVELKQWSSAYPEEDEPLLCRIDSYAQPVLNPIEQVRGYCEYLLSFNGALERMPQSLAGVAFLHNATEFGIAGLRGVKEDQQGRMYTGEQRGAFLDFLRSRLATKPGAQAADLLLSGKVRPSKQLMSVAAAEIRDREQFVLVAEQRDPSFTKATPDDDVDRLIRTTYKVLLTRGMVGTILYSTDAETREKLRSLVHPATGAEVPALV